MQVYGESSEATIFSTASGVKMINHVSFNNQFRINQKGEKVSVEHNLRLYCE